MYYIIIGTLFLIFATCFFVASKVFDYNFTKNNDGEKRFLYATLASFTKALGILFCAISAMVVWNDSDKAECNKEQITATDTIRQVVYVDSIKTEPKGTEKITKDDKKEKVAETKIDKKPFYVKVTCYNPDPAQCQGNPLQTASTDMIDLDKLKRGELHWCAVSRDLKDKLPFGTIVNIDGFGNHVVKDLMRPGIYNGIDILQDENKPQFMHKRVKITIVSLPS